MLQQVAGLFLSGKPRLPSACEDKGFNISAMGRNGREGRVAANTHEIQRCAPALTAITAS